LAISVSTLEKSKLASTGSIASQCTGIAMLLPWIDFSALKNFSSSPFLRPLAGVDRFVADGEKRLALHLENTCDICHGILLILEL